MFLFLFLFLQSFTGLAGHGPSDTHVGSHHTNIALLLCYPAQPLCRLHKHPHTSTLHATLPSTATLPTATPGVRANDDIPLRAGEMTTSCTSPRGALPYCALDSERYRTIGC